MCLAALVLTLAEREGEAVNRRNGKERVRGLNALPPSAPETQTIPGLDSVRHPEGVPDKFAPFNLINSLFNFNYLGTGF